MPITKRCYKMTSLSLAFYRLFFAVQTKMANFLSILAVRRSGVVPLRLPMSMEQLATPQS